MSKPRYPWWSYAKSMVRRYPGLRKEYNEIIEQSVVPGYSPAPGGGGDLRKAESAALRQLPRPYQQELESVESAIRHTKAFKDGGDRIMLIDLMYWRRTHNLVGASIQCHVDESTGKRWHNDFIRCVGAFHGLLPLADRKGNEKNIEFPKS